MTVATLNKKGHLTIPRKIIEQLGLQPGDRVEFLVGTDGRVTLWPVTTDVRILKGLIPKPKQPISLDTMRTTIKKETTQAQSEIPILTSPLICHSEPEAKNLAKP